MGKQFLTSSSWYLHSNPVISTLSIGQCSVSYVVRFVQLIGSLHLCWRLSIGRGPTAIGWSRLSQRLDGKPTQSTVKVAELPSQSNLKWMKQRNYRTVIIQLVIGGCAAPCIPHFTILYPDNQRSYANALSGSGSCIII